MFIILYMPFWETKEPELRIIWRINEVFISKTEYHSHQREQYNRNNTKLSFYQEANAEVLIMTQMSSVQFNSVTQSCPTLCNPMDCSMPGFPVYHHLPDFPHTYVHQVSDAIQTSHPLLSPSPPAINLSQHQGPFQWISSSHKVATVLEFQLQHQSFQWIFRTDFL